MGASLIASDQPSYCDSTRVSYQRRRLVPCIRNTVAKQQQKSIQHYSAAKDIHMLFDVEYSVSMPKQTTPEDMRAFARTQPLSCSHGLPQECSLAANYCATVSSMQQDALGLPVQNICVDIQRIASDTNEPHKPLLLQFLKRWDCFIHNLRSAQQINRYNCCPWHTLVEQEAKSLMPVCPGACSSACYHAHSRCFHSHTP